MYFIFEVDGRVLYFNEVFEEEVEVVMDVCCEEFEDDIFDSFREFVRILMNENDFRMFINVFEVENFYCEFFCFIDNI